MAFGWGAVAGAIGSALINSGSSFANNMLSYHQNMALQHDAQSWQERMSNTAHQREVADLESAGLNPILTAQGGQGASTGSVGANSVNPQTTQIGTDIMNFLANTAQIDKTKSESIFLAGIRRYGCGLPDCSSRSGGAKISYFCDCSNFPPQFILTKPETVSNFAMRSGFSGRLYMQKLSQ